MQKMNLSNSEHYIWGDRCEGWHFLKRDDVSVIKERMPVGTAEQAHLHEKSRQFFYVLSGIATFDIGGEKVVLNPNEGLEIPPKIAHQIRNDGSEPLEFILFSCPTTRGDRVNLEAQ
jgi:mannose-6-phosphate isomerase-like protein (cupin superfamily)